MVIQVKIAVILWWKGCLTGEEHKGTLEGLEMFYLLTWVGFKGIYIRKNSQSCTLKICAI